MAKSDDQPAATGTQERRVKHAMFAYHKEIMNPVDPTGDNILVEQIAYHGQTVDLLPHDIERGEHHHAFFVDGEPESGEGARYPSQFTHSELVEWMRATQPNAQEITNLANDDPDPKQAAEKLLEAEREATGGDPRQEVVVGLQAIEAGSEAEQA